MYLINRKKDNITLIVKSIRPINYLYSKQNKDYDKYFRGSCLKNFVKQINSQKKGDYFLEPGENINEFDDTNKKDSGIDFKNALNYFRELSGLKKLPFSKLNETIIKAGRKSETNKNSKNNKIKLNKISNEKRKINLYNIGNNIDPNNSTYPGKYNPNYDYIKRRYPCAFFGRYKKEDNCLSQSMIEKNNIREKEKNRKDSEELNQEDNEEKNIGTKTNKNYYNKKHKINKNLFISFSNKNNNFKQMRDSKYKQIKYKFVKTKSNDKENNKREQNKNKNIKYITHLKQKTSISSLKEGTISSWYQSNEFDKKTKMKKSSSQLYKTQRFFRNNNLRLNDKYSSEDIKCLIKFDKMQGREKPANFLQKRKEVSKISYYPNYNFIRPHIPTTIFKSERKYQEIKKYITSKIIRSYKYNSGEYFVLDYNKNIENEKEEKYGTLS